MNEIWKDVIGYEGKYQISNLGNARNTKTLKLLKPQKRGHGYLSVWLYDKGRKQVSIHRLVAEVFCDKSIGADEINHKDENKQNNKADNLEWVSHKNNSLYGTRGKRIALKNTNGKRSKRVFQYTQDGKFVAEYPSLAEINRQTGYAQGNILKCIQGDPKYSHAYGYVWKYYLTH